MVDKAAPIWARWRASIYAINLSSIGLCQSVCSISQIGRDLRVVVSTAAFHTRVRGSFPGLSGLKKQKWFFPTHS